MTFEEAVLILRGAGLIVPVGPRSELIVAADPEEPPELLRAQGLSTVYRFGFSLRELDGTWYLRAHPLAPAEQHVHLDHAVNRGLSLLREHRERHSPHEYGDQFALFEAPDPCPAIEDALDAAGWLQPQRRLAALGLAYVAGGNFRAHFPERQRIVIVSVLRRDDRLWRLVVRCYRQASADGESGFFPVREYNRAGLPISDAQAHSLSHAVACVLHRALLGIASELRWALHDEPENENAHAEPLPPPPA